MKQSDPVPIWGSELQPYKLNLFPWSRFSTVAIVSVRLPHTVLEPATGHFLKIISPKTSMSQLILTLLVMAADMEDELLTLFCDPRITVQHEALPFCPAVTSSPHSQAHIIPLDTLLISALPLPVPASHASKPSCNPTQLAPTVQMVTKTNAHMLS